MPLVLRHFKAIAKAVAPLVPVSRPWGEELAEEVSLRMPTFDRPVSEPTVLGTDDIVRPSGRDITPVVFEAFVDGVQRTTPMRAVLAGALGAEVPIHIAHVAAGAIFRDEQGYLYAQPGLVLSRLLLVLPLEGLRRAGVAEVEAIEELVDSGELAPDTQVESDPESLFDRLPGEAQVIVCDTTFASFSEAKRQEERSRLENGERFDDEAAAPLVDEKLFNVALVRSRAQGRVSHIRQYLEMYVLKKLRYERRFGGWCLVDGPLTFVGKKARQIGGEDEEARVLGKSIGLVKTLRARPFRAERLASLLRMQPDERTSLMAFYEEVDTGVKHSHDKPHICWYCRVRAEHKFRAPTSLGLVRIDAHVGTFGCDTAEDVRRAAARPTSDVNVLADRITAGVWRERWPAVRTRGKQYNSVFPVEETEHMLRSTLYSTRELRCLSEMISTAG